MLAKAKVLYKKVAPLALLAVIGYVAWQKREVIKSKLGMSAAV